MHFLGDCQSKSICLIISLIHSQERSKSQLFKSGLVSLVGASEGDLHQFQYSADAKIWTFQRSRSQCGNEISKGLKLVSYTFKYVVSVKIIKMLYIKALEGVFCILNSPFYRVIPTLFFRSYLHLTAYFSCSIGPRLLNCFVNIENSNTLPNDDKTDAKLI